MEAVLKQEKHRKEIGCIRKFSHFSLGLLLWHEKAQFPFQTNQAISLIQLPTTGQRIPLPSPSEQPCLSGRNMHIPSPFLCDKCYDSNLINWPERYLQLYSSIQAGEERDTVIIQLSKFCPSCQTSVYPDSPCVSVFKSSSHHFFGTSLFYILDISQPVSLQLSWSLRQVRAGVTEKQARSLEGPSIQL